MPCKTQSPRRRFYDVNRETSFVEIYRAIRWPLARNESCCRTDSIRACEKQAEIVVERLKERKQNFTAEDSKPRNHKNPEGFCSPLWTNTCEGFHRHRKPERTKKCRKAKRGTLHSEPTEFQRNTGDEKPPAVSSVETDVAAQQLPIHMLRRLARIPPFPYTCT
ncbi:hypothetical protein TGDOM2_357720 [Toxoplasma gondii GAB2-2007-GAL-DOM2]|uniref:Uncharacterized protein n=1 Tax=Toxoplasma gondii GAB2-2007-GAL-DOM2 TaxID=1130820 RepID=A0A086J9E0_TOXGO|nr:hypothetical protein TGDOM2_357720 [Toxoplasma gondii GAB2-2007-GAL-DOM2]